MASGGIKQATGSFKGTGTAIDIKTVGFRPKTVDLFNVAGTTIGHWTDMMADGSMLKQITAGTMSLVTSNGVTPLADGFRVGADTDMNVSGEQVHWVARE